VRYKNRNQVERGFARRKQWRALATRYDKLDASYQATVDIVETLDWLRAVPDHATRSTSHAPGQPSITPALGYPGATVPVSRQGFRTVVPSTS
jgi:hypothetical protein